MQERLTLDVYKNPAIPEMYLSTDSSQLYHVQNPRPLTAQSLQTTTLDSATNANDEELDVNVMFY
jgi:hypothetical protein